MTTFVIAKNTFGEALRKKILWIFVIVALALIGLSFSFSQFSFREEMTMLKGFGLGLISLVGMLITVILSINLISQEVERRTIYTILSKPVRRHEFLLGKFLGSLMTLVANILLMSAVFLFLITWRSHWHLEIELLKGVVMIFFQLFLLGSVCMLFSVFTTPVVNFFLTSAVFIIGNLSDYTASMAKNPEQSFLVQKFYWVVHYLVPNFGNFNVQNKLIHPEVVIKSELWYYAWNITYAIGFAAICLLAAILVFDKRDM